MTISEALRILHCPSSYLTDEDSELAHMIPMFSKAYGQAMAVAFKSLEAWEKVRAEIGKLSTAWEYGQGVIDCLDIINKHLKEVEHD